VRARQVVIAGGPWTEELAGRAGKQAGLPSGVPRHALGLNLVVGRRLSEAAVGLHSASSSDLDPAGGGGRFLFLVPQERSTLLGTWYEVANDGDPGPALDRGTEFLMQAFNRACPRLDLSLQDVVGRQWGRLPLKGGLEPGAPFALAERPRMGGRDRPGPSNLLTVEAVKYTTARAVAERVVDAVLASMGLPPRACRTAQTPLLGAGLSGETDTGLPQRVRRAAVEEMAVTLSDVVYRRTELGDPPGPDEDGVRLASRIIAEALGWDERRQRLEEDTVLRTEAV